MTKADSFLYLSISMMGVLLLFASQRATEALAGFYSTTIFSTTSAIWEPKERPRVALLIHHVPPPYTQFINQPSGPPTHTNQPSKRIPVGRPWSITEKHYSFHPEGRSTNTDFHAIWQEQLFVIGRIR